MPTADSRSMAFDGPLDAALYRLLAHDPLSDVLRRIDDRVSASIAAGRAGAAAGRGGRPALRRRLLPLLAAALVLGGAGGLFGLYSGIGGPFADAFGPIWMRGVDPDVSQTIDGYSVELDRAYLDANRLVLAIRVVDELERRDEPGLGDVHAGDRCEW